MRRRAHAERRRGRQNDALDDLDAFHLEHEYCGDLNSQAEDDRLDGVYVRRGDQSVRGR
jgi:hypothetical protein